MKAQYYAKGKYNSTRVCGCFAHDRGSFEQTTTPATPSVRIKCWIEMKGEGAKKS